MMRHGNLVQGVFDAIVKFALGLTVAVLLSCAMERPPPVPEIGLDSLSESIRAQVAPAHTAFAAQSDDAEANGRLAMLLDAYGQTETAEALYARARHFAPERFRWTYLHARTLLKLGRSDEAVTALRAALAQRPGYPPAQLALAGQLARQGDNAAARPLYTELIKRNPRAAEAHHGYAKLLLEDGDAQAAVNALLSALAISPRYGEAHYTLASAYRSIGEAALADTHLALFERYRLYRPPTTDTVVDAVERLDRSEQRRPLRGVEFLGQRRYDKAIEEFQALAAAHPDSASPHVNLIAAFAELGEFEQAELHATTAASLDPDSVELHDNIGILRLRQGRTGEAIAAFRRAVELDPDNSVPYRNLGAALTHVQRDKEAIEAYRKALELEPTARQTRYLLGQLLLRNGAAAEAVGVLEPLQIVTMPDTAIHLSVLGKAQLAAGQAGAAVETLSRAHALALGQGLEGVSIEISDELKRARNADRS